MAHHKRKRNSKRSVKCTMCTTHRWLGNHRGRFKAKDEKEMRDTERLEETTGV